MNELNINIRKNNIIGQNLEINPSNAEPKSQDKDLNVTSVTSNFRKAASNFVKQCLEPKKNKWTKELLLELANTPVTFRSIKDLGSTTHLNDVVYPILAKLHRKGLVESRPYRDTKGTMLTYRLTEQGFVHSKVVLA